MTRNEIREYYFDWLCELVCKDRYSKSISYHKLLKRLHETEFTYLIPMDQNRAENGIALRWRFYCETGYNVRGNDPCSVLEMMVDLAIVLEESIMDNPTLGDRTGQWFWGMIVNLGLGSMTDYRFDSIYVDGVIRRFLDREYEPNGRGGLFTIKNCEYDLRTVEIWNQMCWYLGTIM